MHTTDLGPLIERTATRLDELCLPYPDRAVGSPGGNAANDYVANELAAIGASVERIGFDCVVWEPVAATIDVPEAAPRISCGPYSPSIDVIAPLVAISSLEGLGATDLSGRIVLLHGDIASEQIGPKNYPFYRLDDHMRIIERLESSGAAAVIGITGHNPTSAGALDPFPLFEDGDFTVPSAYASRSQGETLLAHAGRTAHLVIDSLVTPGRAEQLIGRLEGTGSGRVIVSAHIDSRRGTPGALDNATGVCVLLGAAELLAADPPACSVEFVPFNGEDNFAAYGEMVYLAAYGDGLSDVGLAINIDAAGLKGGPSAVSTYSCPEQKVALIGRLVEADPFVECGPVWPMSDHMVFAMRGVPAAAITSMDFATVNGSIAHAPHDLPGLADPEVVAQTARFVASLVRAL